MCSARCLLLVGAAALAAGAAPGLARADGDPASDYLIGQPVYVPFDGGISRARTEQLAALVRAAKAKGYQLRVTLIVTRQDLGSVTALWRKPQRYATFLGQELFYYYKGPLLIVMPNGYGIYRLHRSTAAERRLLDGLPPPGSGGDAVAAAATNAAARLAAHAGVTVAVPALAQTGQRSQTHDRVTLVLLVLVGAAVGGVVALVRRRRRPPHETARGGRS